MSKPRRPYRIIKTLGVLTAIGVFAVGLLLASLWFEHRMETVLPVPTGPFSVGRVSEAWVDDGAVDQLAPAPGASREVLVWIWYPATSSSAAVSDDYYPAQLRAALDRVRGPRSIFAVLMNDFLTRDVSRVRSHSIHSAAVSPQQPAYPVLIMRGGASAGVLGYSTLAEDLASHGYIVVGIDAPYRTGQVVFPDGRVVSRTDENNPELLLERRDTDRLSRIFAAWVSDIGFVIDRLQRLNTSATPGLFPGRLDLERVGIFGHSFGGAQAAQFCHEDARCKAGIDVDGAPFGSVIQAGVQKPFMFLLSTVDLSSTDPEIRQILANVRSIYDRLPAEDRFLVGIRGGNHFFFNDDMGLLKSRIVLGALRAVGLLGIDGRRQLEIAAYSVRSFFDAYLKPPGIKRLVIASPQYPEIQVLQ